MSTFCCRMTGRCVQSHSRRALAGLEAWMAVSRFYGGLWCGGSSHSSLIGARPCYTRDGCIAQRLELRVAADPHPEPKRTETALLTQERSLRAMTFQATPMDRTLGPVQRMCSSGHMVVFDDDGSYLVNKVTGEASWMREEGGSCIMDLWVMPNKGQGFTRLS